MSELPEEVKQIVLELKRLKKLIKSGDLDIDEVISDDFMRQCRKLQE